MPERLLRKADDLISLVELLNDHVVATNEAVVEFNAAIARSNERIAELGAYSHRNRRMLRGVVVSLVLDVLLTIGVTVSVAYADQASNDAAKAARQNETTITQTCLASNGVRRNDITLWTYVLNVSTPPHPTPAQAKQRASFLKFVKATFAARPC